MVTLKEKLQYALDHIAKGIEGEGVHFFPELHAKAPKVKEVYTDSDGHPVVVFEYNTKAYMRNHMNNVHGGALTTIMDWLSSAAMGGDERYWSKEDRLPTEEEIEKFRSNRGLSRNLKSQFTRPVPTDDTVYVKFTMLSNTKKSAGLSAQMYDSDGNLLFSGFHDTIKLYKPIGGKL